MQNKELMPVWHDTLTLLSWLLVDECFFLKETSSSRALWLRMNWVSLRQREDSDLCVNSIAKTSINMKVQHIVRKIQ